MKYNFKGFKVSIIGNTAGPLFYKNVWRGESEETKVLTHKEEAHLENVELEFHGVELELSGAENLEFIKSIKDLSQILREELIEWGSLIATVDAASEDVATAANEEKAAEAPAETVTVEPVRVVKPNASAIIAEALAKVKASMSK